jgi:hypothetical protein
MCLFLQLRAGRERGVARTGAVREYWCVICPHCAGTSGGLGGLGEAGGYLGGCLGFYSDSAGELGA